MAVESALWDRSPVGMLDQGIWDNMDHLDELAWCDISQVFAREGAYALMKRIHRQYLQIAKQLM